MAMIVPFIGAAAGGAIGGSFLGVAAASWGYMAGSLIASMLQPGQKVQGPRLDDLRVTGSSYGAPIPHIVGRTRIGGQVVWASRKREIPTVTKAGKGGPKVTSTTYTYEVDLLIKLSSNKLAGVRRIFYNNNLVWTASSDSDFQSINASAEFANSVQFFGGDQSQMPWSVYEAAVGAGNAPAFRGSACLAVQGLQLGNSGQIGVITVEVSEIISRTTRTHEIATNTAYGSSTVTAWSSRDRTVVVQYLGGANPVRYFTVDSGGTIYDQQFLTMGSSVGNPPNGTSDRPVAVRSELTPVSGVYINFLDGAPTTFFPITGATTTDRNAFAFAIRGNDIVIGTASGAIHRYDPLISTSALASVAPGPGFNSLLIIDDRLYVLTAPHLAVQTVRVYDLETLALIDTILTPIGAGSAQLVPSDDGSLLWLTQVAGGLSSLYRWDGAAWNAIATGIADGYGALNATGLTRNVNPYFVDGILYTTRNTGTSDYTPRIRSAWPAVGIADIPLADAINRLLSRSGISPAEADLTALAGKFITGMAIVPSATRQPLEMMASVFMFEWCGLKAVLRGGAPVATIRWDELGAAMDGDDPPEALPLKKRNDVEIPAYIHVKYINGENDYQDGLESSDRLATDSYSIQVVEVPIVLSPTQAKRLANMLAADLQASMITVGPVTIQRDWERLEPCDVVLFTDQDGSQMRTRVAKRLNGNGLITLDGPFDDAGVIDATSATDTDYESSTTINVPPQSRALMVDTVPLRDADATTPGAYVAVDALRLPFPGATVEMGPDETSLEVRGQVTEEAAIGQLEGVLGNWTLNIEDDVNAFVINMGDSPMFNVSRDDMFNNNANPWAIGQPGRWEIGQSMDFTDLGNGRWLVRSHLRGRRATEHNCGNHQAGDYFVFLNPAGMLRPAMDFSELNQPRVLRSVTAGRSIQSAQTSNAVNTGEILKPRSPINLRSVRASDGAITATWDRRSRLSQILSTGVVPLDEPTEKFQMVIYTSNTYATERRVIEVNAATAIYTAAMQTADGVTPGAVAYARVFQMSDRVGRGVPLTGIL